MKKTYLILFLISLSTYSQPFNYQRSWATYFGDDSIKITSSDIDGNGNLFLVGFIDRQHFAVNDSNFTTTPFSYQPTYGGGISDGIIVKISPDGTVLWSTFFGGENTDLITALKIDSNNNLCILGSTSSIQNIATAGAYQTSTMGNSSFLTKFSNDGILLWSTYYDNYLDPNLQLPFNSSGSYLLYNDAYFDIDLSNNIYFDIRTRNEGLATSNAFQTTRNQPTGGDLISKFSPTGQRIWATYYGTNGSEIRGLCLGTDGMYISGTSQDCVPNYSANTYFATSGCHQPTPGSCKDIFLSKFSLDGNRIWSTYYGNNGVERIYDKSIVATADSVYLTGTTFKQTGITTSGSFQENMNGISQTNAFLVKFNSDGTRQWGTFYGYAGTFSSYSKVTKDSNGDVFLSGITDFTQNIASSGSYQEIKNDSYDSFVAKFSPNGNRQWGTYYGGNGFERENSKTLVYNNSFYIVGSTDSTENIASLGSFQPNYAVNNFQTTGASNFYIAKFEPLPLSTKKNNENPFSIYPNPNNGRFVITFKDIFIENYKLEMYDTLGKKITTQNLNSSQTVIETNNLSKGLYIIKITNPENLSFNTKIVVE